MTTTQFDEADFEQMLKKLSDFAASLPEGQRAALN